MGAGGAGGASGTARGAARGDPPDARGDLTGVYVWVWAARAARTARRAGLHVATRRMRGATSRGSMCASAGGHSQSPDLEDLHNLEVFKIFQNLEDM